MRLADLEHLPPFQRVLLTTDGTVTPTLAAYLGEDIGVRLLGQEIVTLAERDPVLELDAGAHVLWRRVVLQGKTSLTRVLYGQSHVAVDRLTPDVREALLAGDTPIGLVLRSSRLETFRVLLEAGVREPVGEVVLHLGGAPVCHRTYVVVAGGRPLMVVHEEFPSSWR